MSQPTWSVVSPDGRLTFELTGTGEGDPDVFTYRAIHGDTEVIAPSRLGIGHAGASFAEVRVVSVTDPAVVEETYELVHGKRRRIHAVGHERVATVENGSGNTARLIMRTYDDGIAFRYRLDGGSEPLSNELTEFSLGDGKAWIQPHDVAGIHTPAYEARYTDGVTVGTPADGPSWNLPALFHTRNHWLLIAEADLTPPGFGVHLECDPSGVYRIVPPEADEGCGIGELWPRLDGTWTSPWRVVVVGDDLGPIVETTLITDLATPSLLGATDWITPGRASWSWWSDHESPQSLPALHRYIDFAADMGWEHSLVDANWNVHIDDAIRGLVNHADERGVGLWLWYNSGGPHNEVTEEPRDRMYDPAVRRAEMAKLADWGVAGLKVDFFQSDKPQIIRLMWDILSDAADYQIMINLHGCTVPRGWQRTWPHLMTVEGVRGGEQYAFKDTFPEAAPWHNTILPYTRNVVGPMDYTPVTISDQLYPHLTSTAHEIALGLLFESGVQHYADSIESYQALPSAALELLKRVPAVWDDSRHIAGSPGSHSVIARRNGDRWYVAGIAGREDVKVDFDVPGHDEPREGLLIFDGPDGALRITRPMVDPGERLELIIPARGGFVLEL